MAEGGLDATTWITILGVFVLFFGVPGAMLEYDRRKKLREENQRSADAGADKAHADDVRATDTN